jgi:hypothetical protein
MSTTTTRQQHQLTAVQGNSTAAHMLYLAFELGQRSWMLGFTIGLGQRPRRRPRWSRDPIQPRFVPCVKLSKLRGHRSRDGALALALCTVSTVAARMQDRVTRPGAGHG